jgi:membrane protease YdiL (CAAX protease family)
VPALAKVLQDTAFTLALVILVTLGFYVVKHRRLRGYFEYLGLKKTTWSACGLALAVSLAKATLFLWMSDALLAAIVGPEAAREWSESPNTTGNALLATGATGPLLIVAALLKAVVQTAFLEELFFRGFLARRLVNRLGFRWGNGLQATIFAAMHMAFPFLLGVEGALYVALVFGVTTGGVAWLIVYLNERWGDGSILPGWIVHGVGNAFAYVVAVT